MKKKIWPYLLIAPALIFVTLVVFVPAANAIFMSFQQYDLRRPKTIGFNSFANYITLFKDKLFWGSIIRTIVWVVFGVGFQFILGFCMALLLNMNFRGRSTIRALSMVPWVTPGILIGLMWRWIYDGNYGVLNHWLKDIFHLPKMIPFLSQTDTALPSVIVAIIWQGIPFFALMLLAGLQGVPKELYEASSIDGASSLQTLFRVTIPSISNTILVTTLLRIIWVTNSLDIIYSMTEGGPAYSTQTMSVYVYTKTMVLDLGYASTNAVAMLLMLSLVAIPYVIVTFRRQEEA